ncbi:sigma factor-like helix-turn-helix DNA-binding protein [Candidatus Binatus sp.]|uniref:sigma factor-like helix-turn-helix DNA-binding protein n=1 Tax=Candidatus Binatus sp. TaxID=2811406 RepID=UPI00351D225E
MPLFRTKQPGAPVLASLLSAHTLTGRQQQVLQLRSEGLSCRAVGQRLGVSAERVRQIEARLRTLVRRSLLESDALK